MGLFSRLKKSNLMYYPGCYTYFKLKQQFEVYKKIFDRLGINAVVLDKKLCCGLPALELGYETEARKLARKNLDLMREAGVREIITNCARCYKMFAVNYKELVPDWDIEVRNIWDLILNGLKQNPKLIKNFINQRVGFHDSSYLGRGLGIYNEPREILEFLGCNVADIEESREKSYDSGASGSIDIHNKELADKIARKRLLQFKREKIDKVVVCSALDYIILKRNSHDIKIEIIDISEVIGLALGILEISEQEHEVEPEIRANENILEEIENEEKMKNEQERDFDL